MIEELKPDIPGHPEMSFWDKALEDTKCAKTDQFVSLLHTQWPRREWPCLVFFHRWTKWVVTQRFIVQYVWSDNTIGEGINQERTCEKCGLIQQRKHTTYV